MADRGRTPAKIVGRDDELSWLVKRFDEATIHGASTVVVSGEPGIGKSALFEAFVAGIPALELVASSRCSPTDHNPLDPLRSLLVSAGAAHPDRLVGVPASPVGLADEADAQRTRLFADVTETLLERLADRPSVVVVDDLHWAPQPLYDFVVFLVDELERQRYHHRTLLVLITRVLPPPHRIARVLDDLFRRSHVSQLEVGPLDNDTVRDLVDAEEGPVSSAYLDLVQRSARGNPLRLAATRRVLRQRNVPATVPAADERTWGEIRVPIPLDDPVAAWIHDLPDLIRNTLAVAAVLGAEFSRADLEVVAGVDRHDASQVVQVGVACGLLGTDGRFAWFAHSLFREVLYDTLALDAREDAHLASARHLGTSGTTMIAVGHHHLAAGERSPPEEAAAALRAAGLASLDATSWTDAARYLGAAVRALERGGQPSDGALHAALGRAHYFDHDFAAAEPELRMAVDRAAAAGDIETWGEALVTLMRMITAASPDAWRRPADQALAGAFLGAVEDPGWRSLVLQVLAEAQVTAGHLDESAETAERSISLARRSGRPAVLALAIYARSFTDMTALRVWDGLEGTREALAHAADSGEWFIEGIMKARLPFPLLATGQLVEADDAATVSIADAAANHEHSNQALGYTVRAAAALLRGDLDLADTFVSQAGTSTRRSGYVLADLFTGPTAALAHLLRGRGGAAATAAETWPNLSRSGRRALTDLIAAAGPERALAADPPRAPSTLTQVSAGFYVAALETALLNGTTAGLAEGAKLLDRWRADGFEVPPSYPTSVTRVRAAIAAALGDIALAATLFETAAIDWEAKGGQLELARILAGWAGLEAQRGRRDDAVELSRRSVSLARLCGMDSAFLRLDAPLTDQAGTSDPPQGWRVVMMTDIVDSTRVSRELGDVAYLQLILGHHRLVRACLDRCNGHEFSESGDGLLAWFDSVDDAVQAALDIQSAVADIDTSGPGLRVKVALAGGVPLFHQGRPYGLVLNRAARIVASAHAEEILLDEEITARVGGQRITDPEVLDLRGIGSHRVSRLIRPS